MCPASSVRKVEPWDQKPKEIFQGEINGQWTKIMQRILVK